MIQTVSVLLPISADDVDATARISCVLQQSHAVLEVLMVATDDRVSRVTTRDPRCRVVVHRDRESLGAALNRALRQASGGLIVHAADSLPWASDHLARVVETARGSSARLIFAASEVAHSPVPDLSSLCVANFVAPGHVAFVRDLLGDTGLFDESLTWGTEWDLWLRMARCTEPAVMPSTGADTSSDRRDVSLMDRLNALLAMLRIHARVADLARELPGTANRQWAARRACATQVLALLGPGIDDEAQISRMLGAIAHAALRVGDPRDVDAALALIERFLEHASDTGALERIRLHLLRALGRPDHVMLALGDMTDTSHPDVLRELSLALRQLGQLDDAVAVESMLDGHSLEVPGVPDDEVEIPALEGHTPIAPAWPAWMSRGTADAVTWARAAHAYAVAGLPTAAQAAMQRAVDAGHSRSVDDEAVRTLIDVDRALAERLAGAPSPLVPVRRVRGVERAGVPPDVPPVFLPLSADELERGPFQAALADEVFPDPEQLAVRRFVSDSLDANTTLVEVVPSTLASPVAVLASARSLYRYVVVVGDDEQRRRCEAAITENAVAAIGVVTSDADVALWEVEHGVGPLILHVRLGMASDPFVTALIESVSRSPRAVQLVWSETASPSVASHPAFASVEAYANRLGLAISGVSMSDGVLSRRSLDDDPRPQLLHCSAVNERHSS